MHISACVTDVLAYRPAASTSGRPCTLRRPSCSGALAFGRSSKSYNALESAGWRTRAASSTRDAGARGGMLNDYEEEEAEDYYGILGVPIDAPQAEIKKAYYALMREFHPDTASADDEDTSVHAVFINEVYETLSDPDRRKAYDDIVGLSLRGTNPFTDKSFEADKVFIDEYTCIGCRNCACVASKTFEMEEEHGRARAYAQGQEPDELLQEAIDTCPVSCIHWVSSPQLSLLEDAMRRMDRKLVWIMNNGGGSAVNVFLEASIAWEKRRAAARERAYLEKSSAGFWTQWQPSMTASSYDSASAANDDDDAATSDVRRKTASSVAAASRRWRDLRRAQRQKGGKKEVLLLSASVDDDAAAQA